MHAIVKEVWNGLPLTRSDAERYYTELALLGKRYGNPYFRIVAHGGFLPEALSFELHGLTVSDESYIESLSSGKHVELYPHNEAAYRAVIKGFGQHRIGAVVQATGTGKSYLLARYIADHAEERILVLAPNITILNEIRKAVGFHAPPCMLPDISVTDLSPGESSGDKDGPYFNRRVPSLWCRDLGRRLAGGD